MIPAWLEVLFAVTCVFVIVACAVYILDATSR